MRWSYRVCRPFGIDVYVHTTFLLLLAWVVISAGLFSGQWARIAVNVLAVAIVFVVVVLHELGHALAARRLGIPTQDIVLLPIGGVARLQRMPEKPWDELFVAAAGPAVNLVLGTIFAVLFFTVGGFIAKGSMAGAIIAQIIKYIYYSNVFLLGFNLIPAFPMDGGRMLRAFLGFRYDFLKATDIAVKVGRIFAVLFAVCGLFYDPMLVFIGVFVWLGGGSERSMVRYRKFYENSVGNRQVGSHFGFDSSSEGGRAVGPFASNTCPTGDQWARAQNMVRQFVICLGPAGYRVIDVSASSKTFAGEPDNGSGVRIIDVK